MQKIEKLRVLLEEEGVCAAGIARATTVDETEWQHFLRWLSEGKHAGMHYMENHQETRKDPRRLLSGTKSIISVAFNYRQREAVKGIASYALGEDYHNVLRERLCRVVEQLSRFYGGKYRICIDSAPILERYWAVKCGIGSRSPLHGNIVVNGIGSMVFLAEILTTMEFEAAAYGKAFLLPEKPESIAGESMMANPCPTGALCKGGIVDSGRCINYLTIEHRGNWSPEEIELMSLPGARDAVFGCDICQRTDMSNLSSEPAIIPEFRRNPHLEEFISSLREEVETGRPSKPIKGFSLRKSPLGRTGRKGLMRNITREKKLTENCQETPDKSQ